MLSRVSRVVSQVVSAETVWRVGPMSYVTFGDVRRYWHSILISHKTIGLLVIQWSVIHCPTAAFELWESGL